jgi:hypothetical protein
MNLKLKNITTTIPLSVLADIDLVSKELKLPKNQILVNAFCEWNKQRKKNELVSSYKKMAKDSEFQKYSEMGLKDFVNTMKVWEK